MPRYLPVLAVCLLLFGIVGLAYAGSNNPTHIPANSENFLHYLKHSVIRLLGLDHVKADHFDPGSLSAEESNDDFVDGDDTTVAAHWAVLIAGSTGWGNYRHQADVCHAYQVLKRGGYSDKHIVVMVYDDIASSPMNPHHGKIINRPGGPDVYKGLTPDYSGDQVNAETFLAVLAGDAAALQGKGSGKVIASGPNDRVFVFYSDHGAPGILGMPTGNFLYADALMNTIKQKHLAGGFREMALYIEACESGSIFDGLLDDSLPVYAVTASNGMESSWGTYCPGDVPDPEGLSTCLGDLFSVAWMENADSVDLTRETLKNQYILVRQRTSNNYTYVMGSHALQFGRLTMQKEVAGDYEGTQNKGVAPQPSAAAKAGDKAIGGARRHHGVAQRDADLEHLRATYARAADTETKASAKAALDAELDRRRGIDRAMARATARLLLLPQTLQVLATSLGLTTRQVFSRGSSSGSNMVLLLPAADNALAPNSDVISLLMSKALPGRPLEGAPVVDSWDCLRAMVQQWQDSCGAAMDQYAMKHTRLLANLCNAGLGPADLQVALKGSGCEVQKAS